MSKKGRYSLEQKGILEQALNSDPNPSNEKISVLAQQTGLSDLQVIIARHLGDTLNLDKRYRAFFFLSEIFC